MGTQNPNAGDFNGDPDAEIARRRADEDTRQREQDAENARKAEWERLRRENPTQ